MTIDIDAIRRRLARHASAIGPGGEKAWRAGQLAADVPALLAKVDELTAERDAAHATIRGVLAMLERFDTPRDSSRVRVLVGDLKHLTHKALTEAGATD